MEGAKVSLCWPRAHAVCDSGVWTRWPCHGMPRRLGQRHRRLSSKLWHRAPATFEMVPFYQPLNQTSLPEQGGSVRLGATGEPTYRP